MKDPELDRLLAKADPAPAGLLDRALGEEAREELLDRLTAIPSPEVERRRPGRRWTAVRIAVATAALAAIAVALLTSWPGGGGSGSRVWAAEQIRFAEASPLVLFEAPGWRVTYVDEYSERRGEMEFWRGDPREHPKDPTRVATLSWRTGAMRKGPLRWMPPARRTAPVLGTTAQVRSAWRGRGLQDMTARWSYEGRVLSFRSFVPDLTAFRSQLEALRRVDVDTWLSALPPSVIPAADGEETVQRMLRGIPLPPDFDPAVLEPHILTRGRYQLGAMVALAASCSWFETWAEGRASGDSESVAAAIEAMATAKDWPLFDWMRRQGQLHRSVIAYAEAMPSGRWFGRPLVGDAQTGLGCDMFGIQLEGAGETPGPEPDM